MSEEHVNPFVQEVYRDGDFDYVPPNWQRYLDEHRAKDGKIEYESEDEKDQMIGPDEIALRHPKTGAIVKLSDDGCIDIFGGPTLGLRMDPNTNSLNFFGETINLLGKQVNIETKPNGLSWNNYAFNSNLYYQNEEERGQRITGKKEKWSYSKEKGWHWKEEDWSVQPMLEKGSRTRYSDGVLSIMENLGLPTENV